MNWEFLDGRRAPTFLLTAVAALILGAASTTWASQDAPIDEDAADSSLSCPEGTTAAVAKALHFAGSPDFWLEGFFIACRLDPDHPDRAIVALTYVPGEERTGKTHQGDTAYERDLDIAIIDLSNDKIIAHRHEDKSIWDGGERFERIAIDTGRYVLAPGKRAFGLRVSNGTHCSCANVSYTNLTLYLRSGNRLDRLASTSVYNDRAGYEKDTAPPAVCTSVATLSTTTVAVGRSKNHGLADLELMTTETPSYDFDEDSSQCPRLSATRRRATLHYDGNIYK